MKNKTTLKWLAKSTIFTLVVNLLVLAVMLLYAHHKLKDITSLSILFVLFIISAITYGFVKGDSEKPFIYNLSTLITHIILSSIIHFALWNIYFGWELAMFYYAGIYTAVFFAIVLLVDTIICLIHKIA